MRVCSLDTHRAGPGSSYPKVNKQNSLSKPTQQIIERESLNSSMDKSTSKIVIQIKKKDAHTGLEPMVLC